MPPTLARSLGCRKSTARPLRPTLSWWLVHARVSAALLEGISAVTWLCERRFQGCSFFHLGALQWVRASVGGGSFSSTTGAHVYVLGKFLFLSSRIVAVCNSWLGDFIWGRGPRTRAATQCLLHLRLRFGGGAREPARRDVALDRWLAFWRFLARDRCPWLRLKSRWLSVHGNFAFLSRRTRLGRAPGQLAAAWLSSSLDCPALDEQSSLSTFLGVHVYVPSRPPEFPAVDAGFGLSRGSCVSGELEAPRGWRRHQGLGPWRATADCCSCNSWLDLLENVRCCSCLVHAAAPWGRDPRTRFAAKDLLASGMLLGAQSARDQCPWLLLEFSRCFSDHGKFAFPPSRRSRLGRASWRLGGSLAFEVLVSPAWDEQSSLVRFLGSMSALLLHSWLGGFVSGFGLACPGEAEECSQPRHLAAGARGCQALATRELRGPGLVGRLTVEAAFWDELRDGRRYSFVRDGRAS
jgi:hypothetical protein